MKKLICLILICLMLASVPVSAAEGPTLTEEIHTAMKEAYSNSCDLWCEPSELTVRYYGEYGGCYVGFIDDPGVGYPDAELTVTIAGVDFLFNNYQ